MGNNVSNTDLKERIDLIATNYIQSNKNFENLIDENICNNLVILTSKIINNNLDHKQIEFLYENKISKDKVIYFNKDELDNINLPNNMKKKRYCLGISKFYIKLAHIYASIKKTIEPSNSNLCSKRLNNLINNQDLDFKNNKKITIKPNICYNETNTLFDEIGIPELEQLYYDKFNYETGKFDSMTDKTKKIYTEDVKLFYKIFNNNKLSNNLDTFKNIKIRNFNENENCKNGKYKNIYTGSKKEKNFLKYVKNIQKMQNNITTNKNKLVKILDKLFIKNKDNITINPKLTYNSLNLIVKNTRQPIIDLYLNCEKDYLETLKIFDVIVNNQKIETDKNRILYLKENIEEKMAEENLDITIKDLFEEEKKNIEQQPEEKMTEENLDKTIQDLFEAEKENIEQQPEEKKKEENVDNTEKENIEQQPEEKKSEENVDNTEKENIEKQPEEKNSEENVDNTEKENIEKQPEENTTQESVSKTIKDLFEEEKEKEKLIQQGGINLNIFSNEPKAFIF